MPKIIQIITCALLAIALSGCQEPKTYNYYITHPQVLRKEITRCQKLKPNADKQKKQQCDIVMNAAGQFMAQVTIQQADPETFGATIMKEESILAAMKSDRDAAKQTYESLKAKNAPVNELKPAEEKMLMTEKTYQEKKSHVQALLAIVGLGSPS